MIVIGLCGSSGSGKGYVCKTIKKHGLEYIDTDKIYQRICIPGSKCLEEISMFFGDDVMNKDKSLNKKVLAERVFEGDNAAQHLKLLNTITHKHIKVDVINTINEYKKKNCKGVVVDAPALFESGFDSFCDYTVCVTAPYELKIKRIVDRDRISEKKAIARIDSQIPDERLRELCDYEIVNDGNNDIEKQVCTILKAIYSEK